MKVNIRESILYRTGQAWKYSVMAIGVLFFPLPAVIFFIVSDSSFSKILMYIGTFIGIGSFIFACLTIKCPVCGTHWLWHSVSKKHETNWFDWLFSQRVCPTCKFDPKEKQVN